MMKSQTKKMDSDNNFETLTEYEENEFDLNDKLA